jgi:hypothetical protein
MDRVSKGSGYKTMQQGGLGGGTSMPSLPYWSVNVTGVLNTERKHMPREKIVQKVKQAQAAAGLPPIAPQQNLGKDQSPWGVSAWWSAVDLRSSVAKGAKQGYQTARDLLAPKPVPSASSPVGAPDKAGATGAATVAELKAAVAGLGDGWTVTLSPSLAKRPDQSLRAVTVGITGLNSRDPEVLAQLARLRQSLDRGNTRYVLEDPKDCADLQSPCEPLELSEVADDLAWADAQAFEASMRFFDFMCELDPALRSRPHGDSPAEELMALALESLKQQAKHLSPLQENRAIALLTTASDALKRMMDMLLVTAPLRAETNLDRMAQLRRDHPDATLVMHCSQGQYDKQAAEYMKGDFILLQRERV